MDQNYEGCGRVLKAPFMTIAQAVKFAKCMMDRMKDFRRRAAARPQKTTMVQFLML